MESPREDADVQTQGGSRRVAVVALVALAVAALLLSGYRTRRDHGDIRAGARDELIAAALTDLADQGRALAAAEPPSGSAPIGTSAPPTSAPPPSTREGSSSDTLSPPTNSAPAPSTTTPPPSPPSPPPDGSPSPAPSPSSSPDRGGSEELDETDVVLLTPLLASAEFGATTGFLLACNTTVGAVSSGAADLEPELAEVLVPILAEITGGCRELSAAGKEFLVDLNDGLEALEAANAFSEPFFEASGQVFTALAGLKEELGPLGPIAAALGPIVAHFGPPPSDG